MLREYPADDALPFLREGVPSAAVTVSSVLTEGMTMMQAALVRWQNAGTQVHLVMALWWFNRQLDLITWRLRLNALWWGSGRSSRTRRRI